ncbi:MAG: rod shape-determining protein MreD [Coriobacteriia bacterium]|nr:rod shape-determining protein MreD [Coriobacteriia bacterium]
MVPTQSNPQMKTRLLIFSLVLVLIQIMFASHMAIKSAYPNFMLIATCLWAFTYGSKSGTLAGFIFGLIYDSLALTSFGVMTLILTVVGYLAGFQGRSPLVNDLRQSYFLLAIFALASEFVFGVFILAFGFETNILYSLFARMIASGLYTTLFGIPTFYLAHRFIAGQNSRSIGTRFK